MLFCLTDYTRQYVLYRMLSTSSLATPWCPSGDTRYSSTTSRRRNNINMFVSRLVTIEWSRSRVAERVWWPGGLKFRLCFPSSRVVTLVGSYIKKRGLWGYYHTKIEIGTKRNTIYRDKYVSYSQSKLFT